MQVNLLGPLEVRADGAPVPIMGSRLRRLLTRLAYDAGRPVGISALIDAVWPDDPPADAANALQSLVSRLRRALEGHAGIGQAPGSYALRLDADDVDIQRFLAFARTGREALASRDASSAAAFLAAALGLWRGPALADADGTDYARAAAAGLEEQRLETVADRIDAELALGRATEMISELEELTVVHPVRERFASQLITALQAAGRTTEALAAYEQVRLRLADELGTDPSPALQALHLDLLRAAGAPPTRQRRTNLGSPRTSFVGRDTEAARIRELLASSRLVTVVGAGGSGKTRLATMIAAEMITEAAEQVQDGVWIVELAPVSDPADIPGAMLAALGLREAQVMERLNERVVRDARTRLLTTLAEASCVLVIDNCEHLLAPVSDLLDDVLARAPGVRVLATSREPLGIDGEALCVLGPLEAPDVGASVEDALRSPAIRLFVDRVRAVQADFEVDTQTIGNVIEIVRRLDGLPLALELAAARMRVLPLAEVAARLNDRFRLLTGGSRTALPRHRTLRAVVDWSWDLLTPNERELAERLAVFPAGATLESATAVCAGTLIDTDSVAELLDSLADKSLLQVVEQSPLRYRMLETIREYGVERLTARGDADAVRAAHAGYFASLATKIDSHLRTADQLEWITRLDAELENVLAALRFLGESGDISTALDLVLVLGWYWTMIGGSAEQATWLSYVLDLPGADQLPAAPAAEGLLVLSSLTPGGITDREAWDVMQARLGDLSRRLDGVRSPMFPGVVLLRPLLAYVGGDAARGRVLMDEALDDPDPWIRASAYTVRAAFAENEGEIAQMREDVATALEGFTAIGDRWGLAGVLASRGRIRTLDGDLVGAIEDYEGSLRYQHEIGSAEDQIVFHLRLADLRMRLGDLDGAEREMALVGTVRLGSLSAVGRAVFVASVRALIAYDRGDRTAMAQARDEIQQCLEDLPPARAFQGHARAMANASAAVAAIGLGDLDAARSDLVTGYPIAVATKDLPIVASLGLAVASYAVALGLHRDAAMIVGASARLRGAEDPTDLSVVRLRTLLEPILGAGFAIAYGEGRALDLDAALARLDPTLLVAADPPVTSVSDLPTGSADTPQARRR